MSDGIKRTHRVHELKTWPEPFQAIQEGRKRHEIRRDDRGYAVGDVLHLKEWEPGAMVWSALAQSVVALGKHTGRELRVLVTYMTPGGAWGLPADLCVMSVEVLP